MQLEDDLLAAGHCHVAVGREAAHAVVDGRACRRVEDVDVVVCGKVGVKRYPEDSSGVGGIGVELEERLAQQLAILDHPHPTYVVVSLLGDEQPPIRGEGHGGGVGHLGYPRIGEALRDRGGASCGLCLPPQQRH